MTSFFGNFSTLFPDKETQFIVTGDLPLKVKKTVGRWDDRRHKLFSHGQLITTDWGEDRGLTSQTQPP